MEIKKLSGFFLRSLLSIFLILLLSSCPQNNREAKDPVNLIILFPDQMRGQAMGFLNQEPVLTPHLDRFATESLVLTNVISNYPICSPTRASLMTGKYAQQHGVWSNCNSDSAPFGYELQETARCWSDILKDKGYSLGYIGKWHLDNPHEPYIDCKNNEGDLKWNEWCPPSRRHGFDFWYAYGTYDYHDKPMYWSDTASRNAYFYVDQWGPEHETDLAIRYIKNEDKKYREQGKPFALMVSMNPPHMPYELVPDKYKEMYADMPLGILTQRPNIPPAGTEWGDYYRENIKNYYAMITGVDEQFGRILKSLEETGLKEHTIVLFTSDHGNCLGIHNKISKNFHYEESVRVPFLIRWPGKIPAGKDDLLLSTPDIYPTLLGLMGFNMDIPEDVSGINYASLFLTGQGERPFSQLYMSAVPGRTDMGRRGVRTRQYTLMISKGDEEVDQIELFDNRTDPYQLNNLSESRKDVVEGLRDELKIWLMKTHDPWIRHLEMENK